MPTAKKIESVKQLTEKLHKATSVVLTDYRGLKHKQLEELRKNLRKVDGEFVVVKNRLLLRALRDSNIVNKNATAEILTSFKSSFTQQTAALFSYGDEVAPLRQLVKFLKATGTGKTKAGILGNQSLTDHDVMRLSLLPSRIELLGQLVRQLNAPIQGLHYAMSWNINRLVWALNDIKKKKESN